VWLAFEPDQFEGFDACHMLESDIRSSPVQIPYGVTTAAAVLLLAASVTAQEAGEARSGLKFALTHCAECHAVKDSDAKSPNPSAPSFASVANTRGISGRALAVWLQTSHPTMPNLVIGTEDRNNVIAYIMSLRSPPQR
jgi:mono/diheme cytochrome c family protein